MSTITTATDNMVARILTVLTTHRRLPNPYQIDANSEQILKKGFGVALLSAVNTEREVGCSRWFLQREVGLIVAREALVRELDADSKFDIEQALLEDAYSLQNSFEKYRNLNLNAVVDFKFTGDSGMFHVFVEKRSFFAIQLNYSLEYYEPIV